MKKLKQLLNPGSLMLRIILLNCSMLLLVTIVITGIGNLVYQNAMEDRIYANTLEMQEQVIKSLDLIFRSVSDNMRLIGTAPAVQRFLSVDEMQDQGQRVAAEGEARQIMQRSSEAIPEFLNIVLVSERGQYISNDSYRIKKTPLSQESWYRDAVAAEGALAISHTSFGRNLKTWRNYSTDQYVSVSQSVQDEKTGEVLGVILIDLNLDSIKNLVGDISVGQLGFGYIQDAYGRVVYAPQNDIVYRMNPLWFSQEAQENQFRCRIGEEDFHVIYTHSAYTDLMAVGVYDWNKSMESVRRVRNISIAAAALVMLVAIIASIIYSASITRPISTLSQLMERAQTGDLTVHFENTYQGEIFTLGDAFNSMVDRLNKQVALIYQEQKNKREAELQIMQEQIKPHFLYNTLDTIQWMAKDNQPGEIVKIVLALSNFFRVSLSQGKELITLRQEVEMVKNYLDIQKYRYEDMFEYVIEVNETLHNEKVLKLSLQPLVENALYHGIKESDRENGTIWIRGYRENGDLILQVEDDGAGMSRERCEELNAWMDPKMRPADANAFGTLNVNDRVRMRCSERAGLRFAPREGGGTIATLRYTAAEKQGETKI